MQCLCPFSSFIRLPILVSHFVQNSSVFDLFLIESKIANSEILSKTFTFFSIEVLKSLLLSFSKKSSFSKYNDEPHFPHKYVLLSLLILLSIFVMFSHP